MITISERAKAIHALEQERQSLYEEVADIELQQNSAMKTFRATMREQSNRHMAVIQKLISLESVIERLL